jgi:hypothetical protein
MRRSTRPWRACETHSQSRLALSRSTVVSVPRHIRYIYYQVMRKKPTMLAYWTVKSLFMAIGEIMVFPDKCFNKIMLLLVVDMVFACVEETWLTHPLGETPGPPAITTPVDITADLHSYTNIRGLA